MAKKPTVPSGVAQMSEQEFAEMASKQTPSIRAPKVDLSTVVQRLRSNNVEKVITAPVEKVKVQEQTKLDKKTIDVQTKLVSNVEKLTKAIGESTKFASFRANIKSDERLGAKGRYAAGGRGEEIADKQTIDYRTIGQRIKDKVIGRGQNQFDPNSLKYKFGSVRGLLDTTGLVKRGTGGILDSAVAQREERKFGAATLTKLQPYVKNLKQFGGDDEKVRKYYENRVSKAQGVKNTLQREQDRVEALRSSGMSDFEIQSTPGGSADKKSGQFYKRNLAAAQLVDIDPRYRGEKARDLEEAKDVKFAGPDDDKLNVSEEEDSQLKAIESASEPTKELISITKAENERKAKADMDLLEAIKGIESGGGALGGVASALGGGTALKGAAKGAGKFGKLGAFAAKNSKMLKIGGGVLAGGIAAYEGYSDYKDADEAEARGEITQDEGDIKKTSAVTGAAGGLGGVLGGAALGTMIMPGVGTVIGAGIGGFAGSKLGKGIGEYGAKAWKGLTGGRGDSKTTSFEGKVTQEELDEAMYGDEIDPNDPLVKQAKAEMNADDARIEAAKKTSADRVASQSSDNAIAKTPSNAATSNNIVNAPTTISKQTQNTAVNVPIRDQDHSIRKYYNSRFAT